MTELNIADVLRHYGASRVPEGFGWHSMKCPFHGDSHASGRVNVELNAFKCNACSFKGDALKLICLKEHISRDEAIDYAGTVLHQSVSYVSRSVPERKQRRPLGREKWKTILD